jgi:hypothetical protein
MKSTANGCSKNDSSEEYQCQRLHHRQSRLRLVLGRLLSHCRRIRRFRRWEGENSILPEETKTLAPVRLALPKPLRYARRLGLPCIERPSEVSNLFRRDA